METSLKRTPLYQAHIDAGAKVIDFGGWEMPVQYAGILEECRAVRTAAGLFDVSHMGELELSGPGALALIQKLVTNDISTMRDGQVRYSPMCYPNGGVVDDLMVYRFGADHYWLVVNASNCDKDYAWVQANLEGDVKVRNISGDKAEVALQGPASLAILQPLTDIDLSSIKYYYLACGRVNGVDAVVSRTGYTGEDGFEVYIAPEAAMPLWQKILEVGREHGIMPIGLGARDTLRFEAAMPLYGHELSETITPLEAGLSRYVCLDKPGFIGREALAAQAAAGLKRKLVGFEMIDRGIPRAEYQLAKNGETIGFVTSGTYSPTLNRNLGMGLVATEYAETGTEIEVVIRGKNCRARIIPRPFYRKEVK